MAEYKLLNPNRKAILKLPSGAVHLWFTYYMYESDDQRAYPGMDELIKATGLDKKTIRKWRNYLLENGWLVKCKGSAADFYSKATPGSHQVLVYRVDDPTKGKRTKEGDYSPDEGKVFPLPNIPPKVYASVSASDLPGSFSEVMNPPLHSVVNDLSEGSFPSEGKNRVNQKPKSPSVSAPSETSVPVKGKPLEAKATQAPAAPPLSPLTAAAPVKPRFKKSPHRYDAPFPPDFDADKSPAGVKYRMDWIARHRLPDEKLKELAAESMGSSASPTLPLDTPSPSAPWLAQELFRVVKQQPNVVLEVAAAKWETRWVTDFERLLKVYTGEELFDMIKLSQTQSVPAFNSREIVEEAAELSKTIQRRKQSRWSWKRVEEEYQERFNPPK